MQFQFWQKNSSFLMSGQFCTYRQGGEGVQHKRTSTVGLSIRLITSDTQYNGTGGLPNLLRWTMAQHAIEQGGIYVLAQTNEYASDLHNIGIVHHPEHVSSKSDDSGAGVSFEPPLKSMHSYVLAQHTSLAWELIHFTD